jgi:hypothetical protein
MPIRLKQVSVVPWETTVEVHFNEDGEPREYHCLGEYQKLSGETTERCTRRKAVEEYGALPCAYCYTFPEPKPPGGRADVRTTVIHENSHERDP